jgi:hypothetical protein
MEVCQAQPGYYTRDVHWVFCDAGCCRQFLALCEVKKRTAVEAESEAEA